MRAGIDERAPSANVRGSAYRRGTHPSREGPMATTVTYPVAISRISNDDSREEQNLACDTPHARTARMRIDQRRRPYG
jgi:hypothetical protein